MGLEPWKASKLYGRCDGRRRRPGAARPDRPSAPRWKQRRGSSPPAAAAGLGDEAACPRRPSGCYRLLAAVAPAAADHRDLMQGVELAPGGLARRPLDHGRRLARSRQGGPSARPPCWRWPRRRSTAWPTRTSWSAASSRCCTTCPTSRPARPPSPSAATSPARASGSWRARRSCSWPTATRPTRDAGRPPLAGPAHLQQRGPPAAGAGPVRGGRPGQLRPAQGGAGADAARRRQGRRRQGQAK